MLELFSNNVFLFFFILRLLAPFLIFISPKFAIILSLFFLDAFDGDFFEAFTAIDRQGYQTYDKIMDSWWLLFILIYILIHKFPYKKIFVSLFVYRIVGVVLMAFWFKEWLLIIFPNIFEMLFEFYIFFPQWFRVKWKKLKAPYPVLISATGIVLFREYWLHVIERDVFSLKSFLEKKGWFK